MAHVDILLPTCNRLASLVATLSGVAAQTFSNIRVILADQSRETVENEPVLLCLRRLIESRGGRTDYHYRVPSRGICEQRDFLLRQATAPKVLYLDDDVIMQPNVVARLVRILDQQQCGFVGAFPAGLSWIHDERPQQQRVEFWDGKVRAEVVEPATDRWELWHLHRAANILHASRKLAPGEERLYKVSWVASCILYDRAKMESVGGFGFWRDLPRYHSGEEVLVQIRMMARWGGCAVMPSGTYYTEVPSTVLNEKGTVDGHALSLL